MAKNYWGSARRRHEPQTSAACHHAARSGPDRFQPTRNDPVEAWQRAVSPSVARADYPRPGFPLDIDREPCPLRFGRSDSVRDRCCHKGNRLFDHWAYWIGKKSSDSCRNPSTQLGTIDPPKDCLLSPPTRRSRIQGRFLRRCGILRDDNGSRSPAALAYCGSSNGRRRLRIQNTRHPRADIDCE